MAAGVRASTTENAENAVAIGYGDMAEGNGATVIGQYAKATGLEALFGALYLLGRRERINELFCAVMEDPHGI